MKRAAIKTLISVVAALVIVWPASLSAAEDDSVFAVVLATPPVSPTITKELEKGGVAEYSVKIKNDTGVVGKVGLYPLVYEVDAEGVYRYYDDQSLSRDSSLAKWIDFQRSVIELEMGQEVVKELKIRPAPDAKEGSYQAVIILSKGSTQVGAAEAAERYNEAKITINLTIKAHVVERAEIAEFKPGTPVLTKSPLAFSLKVKNIGNRPVAPKGELILYTKGGKELASAPVGGGTIQPGQTQSYPAEIKFMGTPGRYKVKFLAEYGDGNKELQDIIYVLYMPAVLLIVSIVLLLGLLVYLTILINKRRRALPEKGGDTHRDSRDYVINLKK